MWDQLLEGFEEAWQAGNPPSINKLLTTVPSADRRFLLEELVKIDLEYRWRNSTNGRPPLLEGYSERHPDLGRPDQLSIGMIAWEYLVRRRYGDQPGQAEYTIRFALQGAPLLAELRRVDAELAAEFTPTARKPTLGRPVVPLASAALLAETSSTVTTVPRLMDALAGLPLLTLAQIDQLARETYSDPRSLGRVLLERGWLTPYQLNQVFRGRGHELILGPYFLLERLGEGGVGQVFKAHHRKLNRVVAVKVIRKDLLADAEVIGRFYREMEMVGQLSHPNIVQAYDAGPVGATHILVMEYVEGTDLARRVRQHGPLPVDEACDYIRQAACGLAHAHERGLVHRDIKPSNLLVTGNSDRGVRSRGDPRSELVKILDMGLARLQWTVNGEITNLTTPVGAAVIGTPDYLAPEQALDFHAADIRSDIYSLGCTFYYLLTGQPPFPGGTLTEKLLRHQQADPPPVDRQRPDVPAAIVEILSRMLAKRPEARYQAPAEVAQVLCIVENPGERGALAPCLTNQTLIPQQGAYAPRSPNQSIAPRPKRMLHRLVFAAACVVAAGLLLAAVLPRWPAPPPPALVTPAADLEKLCAHLADPGLSVEDAWSRCQAFRQRHPGTAEENQAADLLRHYLFTIRSRSPLTPQAARARALLRQLPWPLDRLNHKDMAREERPLRSPQELVAVFGKRGRPAVGSVAVHPDGLFVAGGGFDHSVRLWDAADGREVHAWEGLAGPVRALAFSPDGLLLAAGLPDGSIKLWNVSGGREFVDLPVRTKNAAITDLEFAPDGKTLATANSQGVVRLWTLTPPKERILLKGAPGRPVHSLAYSPDGRLLAAVIQPGVLKFWEVPAGKALPNLSAPGARAIAFTPDSRFLAVGVNSSSSVKLYESATHRERRIFRSAQPTLGHSLAFTPDGSMLVSAGGRGLVLWWDAATAREQGKRTLSGEVLHDAALAPDGRHLVLAGGNGTVYVFRLAPGS